MNNLIDNRELENYMKRRNFSENLKKNYRKTYSLSCKQGDGKVWTDSLLLTFLTGNNSTLNNVLSSLLGSRGKILSSTNFNNTLTQQAFTPDFRTQTIIDEEIQGYSLRNPDKEITEETLLSIEIQLAVESMEMQYSNLYGHLDLLIYPYENYKENNNSLDGRITFLRNSFSTKFYDAFLLSFLVKIHPFDLFEINAETHSSFSELGIYYTGDIAKHKYKRFLFLLRDNINASCEVIPDYIFDKMLITWSDDEFREICYVEEAFEDEEKNDYKAATFYATALLDKENYPLISILDRLEKYQNYSPGNSWTYSEKLLIHLDSDFKKIKIMPFDDYGSNQYELKNGIYQKTNYGFYNPNPIWNESIIETLEYYIEKNELEDVFQYFFNLYPSFILDDLHVKAIPHPILSNEKGRSLKPDFIVQKINSNNIDIIELKRPIENLTIGSDTRPSFCADLKKGIAQLKEYREWFRDSQNRKMFYDKYKLDGFEPTLTLIIGRSSGFRNEEVRRRVTEGDNRSVNILTYDDIVTIAKQRRSRLIYG